MKQINGKVRFEIEEQKCQKCSTKKEIIQFSRDTKIKGLPIEELKFICRSCAIKLGLIDKDWEYYTQDLD